MLTVQDCEGRLVAEVENIDRLLREARLPFWGRHDGSEYWGSAIDLIDQFLPAGVITLPELPGSDLRDTILRMKTRSILGPDAWSTAELKLFVKSPGVPMGSGTCGLGFQCD